MTSPVYDLENQCSKATQSNQGNDLEAKHDFGVRAYYEGASCGDNQDTHGNEWCRVEVPLHEYFLPFPILVVLISLYKFESNAEIHQELF